MLGGGNRLRRALMRFLKMLAIVAAATLAAGAGTALSKTPRCCYYYVGTTSQHGLTFTLSLNRIGTGNGYRLAALWKEDYSPAACSGAFLFGEETQLTVPVVHIKNSTLTVNGGQFKGRPVPNHKVTNFTATFTKGKVAGSFTDTFSWKGSTCSTGLVTYSATAS
jgi:hypothetical protein